MAGVKALDETAVIGVLEFLQNEEARASDAASLQKFNAALRVRRRFYHQIVQRAARRAHRHVEPRVDRAQVAQPSQQSRGFQLPARRVRRQ